MSFPGATFNASRTENTVVIPEISGATTDFSFALSDANGYKQVNSSGAVAATIQPDSVVYFPPGVTLTIEQTGSGTVTLTAGSGVTLNSVGGMLGTADQYAVATAIKTRTANTWTVFGNLA